MKKFIKWTMLVYNLLALSFLPLFLTAFLPETSILWGIAWHLNNWLFMALVLLFIPFQQYFIPQILALVRSVCMPMSLGWTAIPIPSKQNCPLSWAVLSGQHLAPSICS